METLNSIRKGGQFSDTGDIRKDTYLVTQGVRKKEATTKREAL
jgi:hypothetical protein